MGIGIPISSQRVRRAVVKRIKTTTGVAPPEFKLLRGLRFEILNHFTTKKRAEQRAGELRRTLLIRVKKHKGRGYLLYAYRRF